MKYRLLTPNETVKDGDEYLCRITAEFKPTTQAGTLAGEIYDGYEKTICYRRAIRERYVLLNEGERIEANDECYLNYQWYTVFTGDVGLKITKDRTPVRRLIRDA